MLTSYIYGSILKMLQGSRHTYCFSLCWDRKEDVMFTLTMIMIDECGDEVIVDTFWINDDLAEGYDEVWEDMKIEKAKKRFPEARGFYFQDSRDYMLHGYEDNYSDEDEWEPKSLDEMILCDDSGVCAGISCPMYWKCQH